VDGDGAEGGEMKDVVGDDIEASAERGREELEPGDFTIAAVEDAARPEQEGTEQMLPRAVLASSAAPPSPVSRLTAVITFGVTGVRINSRDSATDRTRSKRAT